VGGRFVRWRTDGALRVFGDSCGASPSPRTTLFHSRIERPLLRSGLSQRQMIETALELGAQLAALDDRWLLAMYRRQQERAWIADLVEHIEAAIEEAGMRQRVEQPRRCGFWTWSATRS
jgi:hypothetical protein